MFDEQLKKAKGLERDLRDTLAKISHSGTEFLLHELETGLTFAQLAHDSKVRGRIENADRQKDAAILAHQMVLKYLPAVTSTLAQKRRIQADLAELESKLKMLALASLDLENEEN